jgi:hypothetical protein
MWLWWIACAPKEPDWVADCDCPNNQLCVWGGAAACVDLPESCTAAFAGECDLSLVDDACAAAVCGDRKSVV